MSSAAKETIKKSVVYPITSNAYEWKGTISASGTTWLVLANCPSQHTSVIVEIIQFLGDKEMSEQKKWMKIMTLMSQLEMENIWNPVTAFPNEKYNEWWTIFPYIYGYPLSDLISTHYPNGIADMSCVARILLDVANAIDYLHRQGMCHRHIHPTSLYLCRDTGVTKLWVCEDFQDISDSRKNHPAYTDPEMLLSEMEEDMSDWGDPNTEHSYTTQGGPNRTNTFYSNDGNDDSLYLDANVPRDNPSNHNNHSNHTEPTNMANSIITRNITNISLNEKVNEKDARNSNSSHEQWKTLWFKADVYSFGVCALELAYGQPPMLEKFTHPMQRLKSVGVKSYPTRANPFGSEFADLIAQCTADLDKRIKSEDLIKHAFFQNACPRGHIMKTLSPFCRSMESQVNDQCSPPKSMDPSKTSIHSLARVSIKNKTKSRDSDNRKLSNNNHGDDQNMMQKTSIDPLLPNETPIMSGLEGIVSNDGSEMLERPHMRISLSESEALGVSSNVTSPANRNYNPELPDRFKNSLPPIEDNSPLPTVRARLDKNGSESVVHKRQTSVESVFTEVSTPQPQPKVLGRFKVSRPSQSESVMNKNETEHSPPVTPMEELSQSDSRFDEDANADTPHQMGRFFVEKVNKQELANDVKSHVDKTSNSGIKATTGTATAIGGNNFIGIASPTPNLETQGDETTIINRNISIMTVNSNDPQSPTDLMNPAILASQLSYSDEPNDMAIVPQPSVSPLLNPSTKPGTTNPSNIAQWTKEDCIRWISSLGDAYVEYAVNFEKNAIDGGILKVLDDKMLQEIEITKNIHRMVILRARDKLLSQNAS